MCEYARRIEHNKEKLTFDLIIYDDTIIKTFHALRKEIVLENSSFLTNGRSLKYIPSQFRASICSLMAPIFRLALFGCLGVEHSSLELPCSLAVVQNSLPGLVYRCFWALWCGKVSTLVLQVLGTWAGGIKLAFFPCVCSSVCTALMRPLWAETEAALSAVCFYFSMFFWVLIFRRPEQHSNYFTLPKTHKHLSHDRISLHADTYTQYMAHSKLPLAS